MARDELARSRCPKCDKRIGVRPDQFGRRLRCPACQTTFQLDPTANPAAAPAAGRGPDPAVEPEDEVLADEARELVTARPPQRVTATARFRQPPEVVFAATAFAVRRAGGEVLALDRVNLHLK